MGLVFSISNFFIIKTYQANNWSAKKIPSCANLALGCMAKKLPLEALCASGNPQPNLDENWLDWLCYLAGKSPDFFLNILIIIYRFKYESIETHAQCVESKLRWQFRVHASTYPEIYF